MGSKYSLLVGVATMLLCINVNSQMSPVINNFYPQTGPISGGTVIDVNGQGFLVGSSKCRFGDPSSCSLLSTENEVYNSTNLRCTLPEICYMPNSILAGGHMLRFSITSENGVRSNTVNFLVFDLETMYIDAIYPTEGFNSSRTLVSITGEGFVDTAEITCSINSNDTTKVNATFINSTFLQCLLPFYPTSARVHIDIAMNGQPSANLQPIPANATTFTFFVTAPQLVSCQFSSSYVLLYLNFDREVEIGGKSEHNTTYRPDCAIVFSNATLDLIGRDANCFWYNSQQRTIVITLTASSTVESGSVVELQGGNIRTRLVEHSDLTSGNISVSLNADVLHPFPVLEAPGFIPYCGNLTLSGEKSQYGGSQTLKSEWKIGHNFSSTGDIIDDPSIVEFIPSGFTLQSMITIPSNVFEGNVVYTVQLTVKNFLNETNTVTVNITKQPQPGPIVNIVGSQVKQVRSDKEIRLEGMAVLPECLNASGGVDYTWTISTQMGHELDLDNITTQSAVLILPPASFLPVSVHTATLAVSVNGQVGRASAVLVTNISSLRARINGGHYITVSDNDTIILNGKVSEGLTNSITSDTLFTVSWACMNITELPVVLPCLDRDGSLLNTSSTELVYTIPRGYLQAGTYNFSLSLNYRGLESATYLVIFILPYAVPLVTLTPPPRLEAVPVHEKVTLHASIYSDYPGTAQWRTMDVVGFAQLELTQQITRTQLKYNIVGNTDVLLNETVHVLFTSSVTSPPLTNQVTLTLESGVLLADNSYRFRIEATNVLGHTGYAEIDIHTASVPLSGHLNIQPLNGSSLDTIFSLQALWWTDDIGDTPLSYQFGFQYPEELDIQWLSGILTQSEIVSLLPLPSQMNNSVILVLQIYDNKGALTCHKTSFTVQHNRNASHNSIDIMRIMQTIENTSLQMGNWIEGLAHLTALVFSQDRNPSQFDPTDLQMFKTRAINLLIELYRSYIPASKSFLNHLLSLVNKVTYQVELPAPIVAQVLELLESVVNMYKSFEESAVFSKPGFSEDEAKLVFETYANLIAASSRVTSTRIMSDAVTNSLLNVISELGFGMCQQLGIGEKSAFIFADNVGTLKSSWINLPRTYNTTMACESCPYNQTNGVVNIEFSNQLFRQYLQWPCSLEIEPENQCSGVCIISAQFIREMRWQGSQYSSYAKAPFLHVSLANPRNGSVLQTQNPQTSPVTISFPITSEPSSLRNLECVSWNDVLGTWSPQGCTTDVTLLGVVTCVCDHLSEFTVLERCPSGHFGEDCSEVCPQGLWGEECAMTCDCSDRGTCLATNGACNCDPGWSGTRCETSCPVGYWGDGCAEICLCENQGRCNPVDGSCDCAPGWLGNYCNISCPAGSFGDRCRGVCGCRDVSECDTITGHCTCQAGYTGTTCHDECPEGFYGQNCSSECDCSFNGTVSCNSVNGTCDCHDNWMGDHCEIEITSPPPTTTPPPPPGFQIWQAVVPLLLVVVTVIVTVLALVLWRKMKRRKQVLPITQSKQANDGWGTAGGEEDTNRDEGIAMTRAESYDILVPKGSKLKDMFPEQKEEQAEFKEPPQLNGKQRWQIIQLLVKNDEEGGGVKSKSETKSKVKWHIASEEGLGDKHAVSAGDDNDTFTEVYYKQGVYLHPDATLKDLRNAFIDSKQLDAEDRMFCFLNSDVPGDYIVIDTEDEVMLSQIEHNLMQPRTLYIECRDPGSVQFELCTCGKFADLECAECHSRGYCSEQCQQEDWYRHILACQIISDKKRKKHKKKKKKKGKGKKTVSYAYTPSLTLCICGKETEFECSRCGQQGYCSEKCQLEDWSFHEYHCMAPSESSATPSGRREKVLMVEEGPEVEEMAEGESRDPDKHMHPPSEG